MMIADKIKSRETFTPTENTIAVYLQENSSTAVGMSLNELANTLYVSKSSIIRFCKKLGFQGHKELCVELAKELNTFMYDGNFLNPSVPFEMKDDSKVLADKTYSLNYGAISETYNDLNKEQLYMIAKQIFENKPLYLYGSAESFACLQKLKERLNDIHFPISIVSSPSDNLHQALLQEENSTALFVSYAEREDTMMKAGRVLSEKKIPVFLITGPTKSPFMKYTQETVQVSYFEPSPKITSIGSDAAVKLVLDILYAYLFSFDYEHNMAVMNEMEERRKNLAIKEHQ